MHGLLGTTVNLEKKAQPTSLDYPLLAVTSMYESKPKTLIIFLFSDLVVVYSAIFELGQFSSGPARRNQLWLLVVF